MKALICTISIVAGMISLVNAETRTIECRLITVIRGGAPEGVFVDVAKGSGKRLLELKPSASIEADPVEISVSDDKPLRFFDGKGSKASVIGEAKVPGGAESIVVFMLPGAGAKEGDDQEDGEPQWRFAALDLKPEGLKKGGVMVYNGGNSEAKVTVGEEGRSLGLGESEVFGTPASKDDFNMVPLGIQVLDGAKWRRLKDGTTRFVGEIAYWMILFEDPKVKRPQLRIFKVR